MGLTRVSAFKFFYAGKSDVGVVREENQDAFAIVAPESAGSLGERGLLLVVADGMGGLACGATASQLAVAAMTEIYFSTGGTPREALLAAAKEANRRIYQESQKLPGNQTMGSTLTALVLSAGHGLIAQVGDSRAYGLSESSALSQLTRDHTLVQELVERGEIEPDSLPYTLHRNVLTRGLGLEEDVEIDISEISDIKFGDQFLLCSDGLYDVVTEEEIESRLRVQSDSLDAPLDYFIELARSRGAPDNVTVVLVRVEEDDRA